MSALLARIHSVAALAFREALRSRLAVSTALAVAAAIALVRHSVSGVDATHNFRFYSTVAVESILFIAALAASASCVCGETRTKVLQLTRVKPMPMFLFIAGRWLGLLAVFALILASALAAICIFSPSSSQDICYLRITPSLPSVESMADATVADAVANGITDKVKLRNIRRDALLRIPFATVPISPGQTLHCNFHLPRPIAPTRPIRLEITFSSDSYSPVPLSARCSLRNAEVNYEPQEDAPLPPVAHIAITNITSRMMSLPVDCSLLAGASKIALALDHGGKEGDAPVMLQPRTGLALLVPDCGNAVNFSRAFISICGIVALLLALGLALGSFFSLPVALFCAAGLMISIFTAGYAAEDPDILDPEAQPRQTRLDRAVFSVSASVVKSLDFIARSSTQSSPAAMIADSIAIPPREALRVFTVNGILMPLAILCVAAAFLERKELP